MLFSVPIPAKAKAILAFIGAIVVVLTGAFSDDVFNSTETTTVVTQLVEAVLTYAAVFQTKNRGQVNAG